MCSDLFCCLWTTARQDFCYYFIELKCSMLASFCLFLQAVLLREVPFIPGVFSHFHSLGFSDCLWQTWEAQYSAAESAEYQRVMHIPATTELLCAYAQSSSGIL